MKTRISVIIPVFREPGINEIIEDLRGQTISDSVEIIVVDGEASGGTLSLVSDPGVIKIRSPKGRAVQQNLGAHYASGGVLLFLHADTRLPANFQQVILDTIAAGFSGGAFDLEIDDPHPLIRVISKTASVRSRVTGIPYGDQAIFVIRSLFDKIGGFPPIPLMEDIAIMKKIKQEKARFTILPEKALTSARMWHKKGIIYTMVRNPLLALLYHMGVSPKVLVRFYYG